MTQVGGTPDAAPFGAGLRAALPAACLLAFGLLGLAVRLRIDRADRHRAALDRRLAALRPPHGTGDETPAARAGRGMPALPQALAITLARAGLRARRGWLALWAIATIAAAMAAMVAAGPAAAALAGALVAATPFVGLRVLAARRMGRFVAGLPGLLDTLRQSVAAGSSLQQALARATATADGDMRRFLLPLERRVQNGMPAPDAIDALGGTLASRELHMIALAIRVNLAQGGRMAPVLRGLSAALRDQQRVGRELSATTAETRWSAVFLASLPPVAAIAICAFNPAYPAFFLHTPLGGHLLLAACALEGAGVLAMRRILRVAF